MFVLVLPTDKCLFLPRDYVSVIFNLRGTTLETTFGNVKKPSIEQYCTLKRYRTKHESLKTVTNKKGEQESNSNERGKKEKTSWVTRLQQSGELETEEKKGVQRSVITDWVYTGLIVV